MEWKQIGALLIGNLAIILPLWLWNRSESRSDAREMNARMDSLRISTEAQINSIREAVVSITLSIKEEMKDFHGRLCTIEERNRNK